MRNFTAFNVYFTAPNYFSPGRPNILDKQTEKIYNLSMDFISAKRRKAYYV